jgi:choline dehydrogenase-like flavoprotein
MRIATGNTGGLIPLPIIDPDNYGAIVDEYLGLDLKKHLPAEYADASVRGYEAQRKVMADMMRASDNAFLELPLFAGPSYSAVLIKVLSRGTVMLDPKNKYGEPIVDYHTYGVPSDRAMMRSILRFIRRFHATPAMQELGAVEVKPGADLVTDQQLDDWLRQSSSCSTAHNSCSNPMMPREMGGVVGPDLLVYGVTGLSVADSSVMPIIPGAHICSSVYAVAEKVGSAPSVVFMAVLMLMVNRLPMSSRSDTE